MIIAQVCLRLATIKGHCKICSFTVLGGPKTSHYLVWPPFASCSATHLLRIEMIRLLIVAFGMLVHSTSIPGQSYWISAGPRPSKNWDVFTFQLCTDPCNMGLCIIMLQHEVMVMDERHNNGPQDLCAFKMPSLKCTCVCCP